MEKVTLLIGHGSKDAEGDEEFRAFARRAHVRYCMLDYVEPTVSQAFSQLASEGVKEVAVIPYFLFAGGHVKYDIPNLVSDAQRKYPHMKICLDSHLGLDEALLQVSSDRVGLIESASVLLVGRGSLEAEAIKDMEHFSSLFKAYTRIKNVQHCYIALAEPDLPTGIVNCRAESEKEVVVFPYFLFTGVLVKRIEGIARELSCALRPHLGHHEALIQLIQKRRNALWNAS